MNTVGVDIGAQTAKAVVLKDGRVSGSAIVHVVEDASIAAEEALDLALKNARISRDQVQRIFATGIGYKAVRCTTDNVTEIGAAARGAAFLFPSARTVIDLGAEGSRSIRVGDGGKVLEFAKNEKCAAGAGTFIETMARTLELRLEELGELARKSQKDIPINVTCAVFAESEVVSLIHAKTPKEDIARAILEAVASRTTSMVRKIGIEPDVVVIGGVARNAGVMERLSKHLGKSVLIPEDPQTVGALGAALIARG